MGIEVEGAKRKVGVQIVVSEKHSARKLKLTTYLNLLTDEKYSFLEIYVPSSDLN